MEGLENEGIGVDGVKLTRIKNMKKRKSKNKFREFTVSDFKISYKSYYDPENGKCQMKQNKAILLPKNNHNGTQSRT